MQLCECKFFLQSLYQAFLEVCNSTLRILNIQIWKMCFFALQFVRILEYRPFKHIFQILALYTCLDAK